MYGTTLQREVAISGSDYALTRLPSEFHGLTRKQIGEFLSQVILCALLTYEDLRTLGEREPEPISLYDMPFSMN